MIYLRPLDFDDFITHILSDIEHNVILQHVLDHLVALIFQQFQQYEDVLSSNLEIGIVRNGYFELCIFC